MIVRPQPVEALRVGPAGRLELNPDRRLVQAWVQGTSQNERLTIAALGVGRDAILVQAQDALSGDFLLNRFTSDHLGGYRVQLYRQGSMPMAFMNVPVRIEFLTGFSDEPFYPSVPIYCEARSGLQVEFTNLTTGIANQIRFKAHGERYFCKDPDDVARLRLERFDPRQRPFWLGPDNTTITLTGAQANAHANVTVPSDGDFESEGFWVHATGPFLLKISTSLGGAPLMNGGGTNQVLVYSDHFGGGRYFYRWPTGTAYFKRMTVLDLEITNFLATTNTIELVQVGRLLDYPEGSPDLRQFNAAPPMRTPGPSFNRVNGGQLPAAFLGLNYLGT